MFTVMNSLYHYTATPRTAFSHDGLFKLYNKLTLLGFLCMILSDAWLVANTELLLISADKEIDVVVYFW